MKSLLQIHRTDINLLTEITFSITELKFLLKLVNKEYSICLNNSKVKILDSYYVMFEQQVIKLLNLKEEVVLDEKGFKSILTEQSSEYNFLSDNATEEEYTKIHHKIKTVKESFYDYILNNK